MGLDIKEKVRMKLTKVENHKIRNALLIAEGNIDYICLTEAYDFESCKAAKIGMKRILNLVEEAEICD